MVATAALAPSAEGEKAVPAEAANPTVVELFTSQGCSSCPPADELLGELSNRPGLLALSLPVDYWDYIGWKDTYASATNTARQRGYAHSLHHRSIYTPEMIIGGLYDAVGSDRTDVTNALAKLQARHVSRTSVDMRLSSDTVTITVNDGEADSPATIWLVRYDAVHTVSIGAGENRGRHITYHNVVRSMKSIGTWTGRKVDISFDRRTFDAMPGERSAVIVQYGETGPIVGAADFSHFAGL